MDQLDVRLFRSLVSTSGIAPSRAQVSSSLKAIARQLGADDATISYRYKRMQEKGCFSSWSLMVNPSFFGYRMLDVMVDVQPESAKADLIRKLRLVHEVTGIVNFYGKALKVIDMHRGEDSRSRIVDLISRLTNAETLTQFRWTFPQSRTERMTETDLVIFSAFSKDARKSPVLVAKELGLSVRTIRIRVDRLRGENTIFALPSLNFVDAAGFIPVHLSYAYSTENSKSLVDRAMLSHFDTSYLWGGFTDSAVGYLMINATTMSDVRRTLEWAEAQHGVASARVDIVTDQILLPEKQSELLQLRNERATTQRNAS